MCLLYYMEININNAEWTVFTDLWCILEHFIYFNANFYVLLTWNNADVPINPIPFSCGELTSTTIAVYQMSSEFKKSQGSIHIKVGEDYIYVIFFLGGGGISAMPILFSRN